SLADIFNGIYDFTTKNYGADQYIKEFFAIDYYLYSKQRPQNSFGLEIEKTESNKIIERLRLNHQKYRFVILDINFDWDFWMESNCIFPKKGQLIIRYDGQTAPVIQYHKDELVLAG